MAMYYIEYADGKFIDAKSVSGIEFHPSGCVHFQSGNKLKVADKKYANEFLSQLQNNNLNTVDIHKRWCETQQS
jgi:hypothetical protein